MATLTTQIYEILNEDLSTIQLKYKTDDWRLIPNRILLQNGKPFFQINNIGLKGIKTMWPEKKRVVVWGDSVVFGIGAGWVDLANSEKIEFLKSIKKHHFILEAISQPFITHLIQGK